MIQFIAPTWPARARRSSFHNRNLSHGAVAIFLFLSATLVSGQSAHDGPYRNTFPDTGGSDRVVRDPLPPAIAYRPPVRGRVKRISELRRCRS